MSRRLLGTDLTRFAPDNLDAPPHIEATGGGRIEMLVRDRDHLISAWESCRRLEFAFTEDVEAALDEAWPVNLCIGNVPAPVGLFRIAFDHHNFGVWVCRTSVPVVLAGYRYGPGLLLGVDLNQGTYAQTVEETAGAIWLAAPDGVNLNRAPMHLSKQMQEWGNMHGKRPLSQETLAAVFRVTIRGVLHVGEMWKWHGMRCDRGRQLIGAAPRPPPTLDMWLNRFESPSGWGMGHNSGGYPGEVVDE